MTNLRYLGAAELAAVIRQALKAQFPKTKFSVRSSTYSMGSSVNMRWTDGPSQPYVEELTDGFQGISFDGRDDSTSYHPITLPSGEQVSTGSYVTCNRSLSDAFLERLIGAVVKDVVLDRDPPTVADFRRGLAWYPVSQSRNLGDWCSVIHQLANDRHILEAL